MAKGCQASRMDTVGSHLLPTWPYSVGPCWALSPPPVQALAPWPKHFSISALNLAYSLSPPGLPFSRSFLDPELGWGALGRGQGRTLTSAAGSSSQPPAAPSTGQRCGSPSPQLSSLLPPSLYLLWEEARYRRKGGTNLQPRYATNWGKSSPHPWPELSCLHNVGSDIRSVHHT